MRTQTKQLRKNGQLTRARHCSVVVRTSIKSRHTAAFDGTRLLSFTVRRAGLARPGSRGQLVRVRRTGCSTSPHHGVSR